MNGLGQLTNERAGISAEIAKRQAIVFRPWRATMLAGVQLFRVRHSAR
jgi:hypothetical protein